MPSYAYTESTDENASGGGGGGAKEEFVLEKSRKITVLGQQAQQMFSRGFPVLVALLSQLDNLLQTAFHIDGPGLKYAGKRAMFFSAAISPSYVQAAETLFQAVLKLRKPELFDFTDFDAVEYVSYYMFWEQESAVGNALTAAHTYVDGMEGMAKAVVQSGINACRAALTGVASSAMDVCRLILHGQHIAQTLKHDSETIKLLYLNLELTGQLEGQVVAVVERLSAAEDRELEVAEVESAALLSERAMIVQRFHEDLAVVDAKIHASNSKVCKIKELPVLRGAKAAQEGAVRKALK